jgi:hypothetical protein
MTPAAVVGGKHFPSSLQVKTAGGSEPGVASITDADLKGAIEAAVIQNELFKTVVQGADGSDYELTVRIVNLAKPLFGGTFTVELEATWSLIRVADRSAVLRKSIKSTGVANMGEAFAGAVRIRMAVERAASDNISQGLQAIAELKL